MMMVRRRTTPPAIDPTIALIRNRELSSAIAKALGVTRQAISQWTKVPWNRVLVVAGITGRAPHEIRPDIYPPPDRSGGRKANAA